MSQALQQAQKVSYKMVEETKSFCKRNVAIVGTFVFAAFVSLTPQEAMAALPTSNSGLIPTAVNGTDSLTQGAQLTELLLKWGSALLGVAIVIGSIAAIFKSFKDRKNGDNSDFAATMGGGLVMIVIGTAVTIVGYNYAAGLAAQVMALG